MEAIPEKKTATSSDFRIDIRSQIKVSKDYTLPLLVEIVQWVNRMLSKEDQNNYREIFEPYLQGKCPRNLCDFSSHGGQMLKSEKTVKAGIQAKRLKAGWDEDYLRKVLSVSV